MHSSKAPSAPLLPNSKRTLTPKKKKKKKKIHPEFPKSDYLGGYRPLREDFEVEWGSSCEDDIASLQFDSDESSDEYEMKLSLLELYNMRLEKRRQIKRFVVDHQLHNFKYQAKANNVRSKLHREIHHKMKKYLQIMSNAEYEEFVIGLVTQDLLEKRILELQEHRRNGITTFDEANNTIKCSNVTPKDSPVSQNVRTKPCGQPLSVNFSPTFEIEVRPASPVCDPFSGSFMPMDSNPCLQSNIWSVNDSNNGIDNNISFLLNNDQNHFFIEEEDEEEEEENFFCREEQLSDFIFDNPLTVVFW